MEAQNIMEKTIFKTVGKIIDDAYTIDPMSLIYGYDNGLQEIRINNRRYDLSDLFAWQQTSPSEKQQDSFPVWFFETVTFKKVFSLKKCLDGIADGTTLLCTITPGDGLYFIGLNGAALSFTDLTFCDMLSLEQMNDDRKNQLLDAWFIEVRE